MLNGQEIAKPAGYYFDIVWIRNDIARTGRMVADGSGEVWTIAETFGARPMASGRWAFRAVD